MSDEERMDIPDETPTPPEAPPTPPPTPPPAAAAGAAAGSLSLGEQTKGLAELKRILRGRKILKTDMAARGMKSRKEFKILAESLGLALWQCHPALIWLHHALAALLAGFGLKALAALALLALLATFLASTISEEKGSFTVNMTGDMLRAGFILSETADCKKESSRLFSARLEEVNNITIEDIAPDVDEVDGAHNGDHYIAYTFYIKNTGETDGAYAWYVRMGSEMMNVSRAVWLMVFEDGRQVTYTRAAPDGSPEELFGFSDPLPFSDVAYDAAAQYYATEEGGKTRYGIKTSPYADDEKGIVAQGLVEDVSPGESHKYTVVLWLEGHDPECVDDIFGGFAKFDMEFKNKSEMKDSELFGGVFRTEYDAPAGSAPATDPETDPSETDPDTDTRRGEIEE